MMNIRIAACGGGTARLTVPNVVSRLGVCLKHLARFELLRREVEGHFPQANISKGSCGIATVSMGSDSITPIDTNGASQPMSSAQARVDKFRAYVFKTISGDSRQICEWCGIELKLLLVTPCVHLYCTDCVEKMV